MRALAKVEALRRLLNECPAIPAPLTQAQVGRLVEWIERVPCHELVFSSLDGAVSRVRALLDA